MTRLDISIGSSANDGTGDTLRSAGNKINLNFILNSYLHPLFICLRKLKHLGGK